jgi:excisionase family DNA binding protein
MKGQAEMNNGTSLLTAKETGAYLGIKLGTVYTWKRQNRLPFIKLGKALRFRLSDLEAMIEAARQKHLI